MRRTPARASALVTLLFALAACSDSSTGSGEGDGSGDTGTQGDTLPDTADSSDSGGADTGAEVTDTGAEVTDTGGDAPDGDEALLPDGSPCDDDAACESQRCLRPLDAATGICTSPCAADDDCAEGFDCLSVASGESDARSLCVPVDLCIDGDGDGFGVGPGCRGIDCDDSRTETRAGADEICDGADNDCDTEVDESAVDAGADCDTGFFGACAAGRLACSGGSLECVATAAAGLEACDGIDNDCDGTVDDEATDAPTWYADTDGDQFGDAASVTRLCGRPAGFVAVTGDCDDTDATRSPVAIEACDERDNDCDGLSDEPGAVGETPWYRDVDGDGAADRASAVTACAPPTGYGPATTAWDCDDTRADAAPGATEVCDGIDNDCDGEVDEAGAAPRAWLPDVDGDGFGDLAATPLFSCEPVAGSVVIGGDCDDTDRRISPIAVERCNGLDDDCDDQIDEPGSIGESVWYADTDSDGFGDLAEPASACSQPGGYVALSSDCDDTTATIRPGADERCDDIDQDCDGRADDPEAVDAQTFFRDRDADDHGDALLSVTACSLPTGYALDGDDCDDSRADVSPSAPERCDAVDNDCDGESDEAGALGELARYADADLDTYGAAEVAATSCNPIDGLVDRSGDCDDTNADIRPGGSEACNLIDDDCDGAIDEAGSNGEVVWFDDADLDGFGALTSALSACRVPDGYVANADDCDDTNVDIYPGATEYCDSIDQDCDRQTADPESVDALPWYRDADGDGHGNPDQLAKACSVPTGYTTDPDDCNDTRASISPSARESCDGIDNNCDGAVDEAGALGESTFYADRDLDGYGDSSAAARACSAPSGYVDRGGDCDDSRSGISPGSGEVCNGIDDNCNGAVDDGVLTAFYRDADGDGWGNAGDVVSACSNPGGRVTNGGDANDGTQYVAPDAPEICDGWDNNQNGSTDEGVCPSGCSGRANGSISRGYMYCQVSSNRSWSAHRERCRNQANMDLVTINNGTENDWILNNRPWDFGRAWIGLERSGSWRFVSYGLDLGGYNAWSPGEPSGDGTCGMMFGNTVGNSGRWNDAGCSTNLNEGICEWRYENGGGR